MNESDRMTSGKEVSLPISTVHIGAWGKGGQPIPFVTTAVCAICGQWATGMCVAGDSDRTGDISDARVSRSTRVCVYACDEHYEQTLAVLADEFGSASNRYDQDDLAEEVYRRS